MALTVGKIRRLQQCAGADGRFTMLALDHRNNLRRALNPANPASVTDADMAAFKVEVIAALGRSATAVLLDPEVGAAHCVAAGVIPGATGLLVAVEATGYTDEPTARRSQILPGWSVEKIARMGGTAVKLLIYYHPEARNAAAQEALVQQVAEACCVHDLPFFLEPLSFATDPAAKKLSSAEKRAVVVETARRLTPLGVDILKAEFPLDIQEEPDEAVWAAACAALSAASTTPWVLLSAGVNFEQFERQTAVACQNGASGVLAGRAVWKEAVAFSGAARTHFLQTTARDRMARLVDVIGQYGRAWTAFHPHLADSVPLDWYKRY